MEHRLIDPLAAPTLSINSGMCFFIVVIKMADFIGVEAKFPQQVIYCFTTILNPSSLHSGGALFLTRS